MCIYRERVIHLCGESQRGARGERERPLAIRNDLDVGAGGGEPQLAEVPLEDTMHLRCLKKKKKMKFEVEVNPKLAEVALEDTVHLRRLKKKR